MAKSKNRRKNGKVKQYKPREAKKREIKYPTCKHCGSKTRLASPAELAHFKAIDSSFNVPFLFLPTCNCFEEHEDWMEYNPE